MGKFKELRVWQDAISLSEKIYQITGDTSKFSRDFGLKDQMRRAVVSIASNIAEGDERSTTREAVYFFNIAKGSSAELITQLCIAHRIGYIETAVFENIENEVERVRATLKNLIKARSPNL